MWKLLKGKELGNGISKRKDRFYQGRFVNRFGKRQTCYVTEDTLFDAMKLMEKKCV